MGSPIIIPARQPLLRICYPKQSHTIHNSEY